MTSPTYGRMVWLWVLLLGVLAGGCSAAADGEDVDSVALAACTGSSLSASPAGPVNPGVTVTLTATAATCGTGETAEYRFSYKRIGAPGFHTEIQAYSTSPSAPWDTTGLQGGQYDLIVYTRAVGSGAAWQATAHRNFYINDVCTSATLSTTPAPPSLPGVVVGLTSTASCNGGAAPEFRYFYRPISGGAWTQIQDWGPGTANWDTTGLPQGTYSLLVYVRATGNTSGWEATRHGTYTLAGGSCFAVTSSVSPPSPQLPGTVVAITGSATCDGGFTPEYRFYYLKPGNSTPFLIQDWGGAAANWDTTGLPPGTYTIRVDTRAAQNGGQAEKVSYSGYTLSSVGFSQIAVGQNFTTCGVVNNGTARCWGENSEGQIGNGSKVDSSSPAPVTGLSAVSKIAPGGWHSCAVRTDGSVRCWGLNSDGQLGTGTQTASTIPVAVSGVTNATAISSGTYHSCALISGGTVMCWGDNEFGQIGNGASGTNVLTPTTVTGVTGATAIAAGGWHTCALVSGGAVKCWGLNDVGQMGSGSTNNMEPAPVSVSISGATGVSAGDSHNCAIVSNSQPYCWGLNTWGQLGNGTINNSNVPVAVGIGQMTTVSAGYAHTCARRYPDGSLRCWGDNGFGELGVVGLGGSLTPVTVTGITSATSVVAAGGVYSCSLQTNGSAFCWGYNGFGQLGDGSTADSSLPVAVLSP